MDDNQTDKQITINDASQVLGYVFNRADNSLSTASFITGVSGRKITRSNTAGGNLNGAAAGDDWVYTENSDSLYTIRVLYSDLAKTDLISVERVA